MAKSNNFSLYLLKEGFNAQNSLKDNHNLTLLEDTNTNIPKNGIMYYGQNPTKAPWWKEYWGIKLDLKQTSVNAIVFLPVNNRCFAVTFGTSYHNLRENAYEYDFGLITTLNALDPEKIKSTDLLVPDRAKRQRIQIPAASNITYFDFNADESIIKRLTGAVKEEYRTLFRNATGSSSLRFATIYKANELTALCIRLLEIYMRHDYKKSFPDLHNIIPIKDPDLIRGLDNQLLAAFQDESSNITLSIPDIVDYSTNFRVRYRGAGKQSQEYEDVFIGNYRDYIHGLQINIDNISYLNSHTLCILDENENLLQSFSIYKSLLFDCTFKDKTYHLCDGCWYEINTNFIEKLKKELDPIFIDTHKVLYECNQKREDEYNVEIQRRSSVAYEVICLDKKNIAPNGQTPIEPCDIIALNNDKAELIHNKISTRSACLSHLFHQGVNSVTLLLQDEEAKEKLKALVRHNSSLEEKISKDQYQVTFGIISNKKRGMKSDALPLFSRISLLRCVKTLKLMKISTAVFLITDNVDRKH